MALLGAPTGPGVTNRNPESALLPADRRKPGFIIHDNLTNSAAVEPREAEMAVPGSPPVPASLLLDAADRPDTHIARRLRPDVC